MAIPLKPQRSRPVTKPIALVLAVALLGAAPAVTAGCAPAKAKDTAAPAAKSDQAPVPAGQAAPPHPP